MANMILVVNAQLRSLVERRKGVGLSQYRLAVRAEVSKFRLAMYELGQCELSSEELGRIDRAISEQAQRIWEGYGSSSS
jgi:predicted transcriptional regulator